MLRSDCRFFELLLSLAWAVTKYRFDAPLTGKILIAQSIRSESCVVVLQSPQSFQLLIALILEIELLHPFSAAKICVSISWSVWGPVSESDPYSCFKSSTADFLDLKNRMLHLISVARIRFRSFDMIKSCIGVRPLISFWILDCWFAWFQKPNRYISFVLREFAYSSVDQRRALYRSPLLNLSELPTADCIHFEIRIATSIFSCEMRLFQLIRAEFCIGTRHSISQKFQLLTHPFRNLIRYIRFLLRKCAYRSFDEIRALHRRRSPNLLWAEAANEETSDSFRRSISFLSRWGLQLGLIRVKSESLLSLKSQTHLEIRSPWFNSRCSIQRIVRYCWIRNEDFNVLKKIYKS